MTAEEFSDAMAAAWAAHYAGEPVDINALRKALRSVDGPTRSAESFLRLVGEVEGEEAEGA